MSQNQFVKSGLGGMFIPPRYRNFVVAQADATVLMYSGIDVTPEDVFRRRETLYNKQWAKDGGKTPAATFRDNYGDQTVWSDNQLVAVCVPLTPGAAGMTMIVYRFDKFDQDFERGRVWCRFRDPEQPGPDVDEDEEAEPEAETLTDAERAILKVVRALGLSLETACEALGRWSGDND